MSTRTKPLRTGESLAVTENTMRDVRPLIEPRSLALVGASPRRLAAVLGVQREHIPGLGVNPSHDEVLGDESLRERCR